MKLHKLMMVACFLMFLLTGCDMTITVSNGSVGTETGNDGEIIEVSTEEVIPAGAVVAEDGQEIVLSEVTIQLPEDVKYGCLPTSYYVTYFVWRGDKNYVMPSDSSVLFYVIEGKDVASPDTQLTTRQATNSLKNGPVQLFEGYTDATLSIDVYMTTNSNWYTLAFTGFGGDYLMTSYGSVCYPKAYYGFSLLQAVTETHDRMYYTFAFSNAAGDGIFSQEEYESVFGQIKEAFSLTSFYSDNQNDYAGRNYEELEALFHDVENYYILKEKEEETFWAETESGSESGNS